MAVRETDDVRWLALLATHLDDFSGLLRYSYRAAVDEDLISDIRTHDRIIDRR